MVDRADASCIISDGACNAERSGYTTVENDELLGAFRNVRDPRNTKPQEERTEEDEGDERVVNDIGDRIRCEDLFVEEIAVDDEDGNNAEPCIEALAHFARTLPEI